MNISLTSCLDLCLHVCVHVCMCIYVFVHRCMYDLKCICFQNASIYWILIGIFDSKDNKLVQQYLPPFEIIFIQFSVYTGYSCQPSLLYSFDKMCDQTVYDESGRGNNGQLHASVIVGQGKHHHALDLFIAVAYSQ